MMNFFSSTTAFVFIIALVSLTSGIPVNDDSYVAGPLVKAGVASKVHKGSLIRQAMPSGMPRVSSDENCAEEEATRDAAEADFKESVAKVGRIREAEIEHQAAKCASIEEELKSLHHYSSSRRMLADRLAVCERYLMIAREGGGTLTQAAKAEARYRRELFDEAVDTYVACVHES